MNIWQRNLTIAVLYGLLTGCGLHTIQEDEVEGELAGEILQDKVTMNGEKILCDQPLYLECFNITKEQCYSEITPSIKQSCVKYVRSKTGKLNNQSSIQTFARSVMGCLYGKHLILMHYKQREEIEKCMNNIPQLDGDQILKSLWQ